jgi:glycine/D-amino acid oxidase-like deaminating enzyme/nitrite reductase/ring-hydroxylating ferredoxin subunit
MKNTGQNNIQQRDSSTESIWQRNIEPYHTDFKGTDKVYDTLIIGAGITGITTALMLQQSGQHCIIVEAGNIGFGTTGGTSAHLNTFFDATYPEIESDFGEAAAKTVAAGGKEAIATIRSFIDQLNIDCDFEYKQAWLFSENEKETEQLQEILEAAKRAGISVENTEDNSLPIPFQAAVRFEEQGQFHPLKYISGLFTEFIRLGGGFAEHNRIRKTSFEEGIYTAKSDSIRIQAKNMVYATHIPPGVNLLSFRNAPYRSYVLGVRLKDENYPKGLAYDMQEPYHYFRTHIIDGKKYLIVGGEDHKTGHENPLNVFANLKNYVSQYYNVESVDFQWSAQYYVPVDGLPYIGEMPGTDPKTFVATGFNGNGMIYGTLSGKIISDLILEKNNDYVAIFNPSRLKPVAGFTEFIKETADVAWHFIADRFTPDELKTLKALKPGQGKVVNLDGKRVAIYKNDAGTITALNPTCTHAGCIVQFNEAEKSWDCPCHGGRYDISGKVLTGPTTKNLDAVTINQMTKGGDKRNL